MKPLLAAMIACGVLPCVGAIAATITVTTGGDSGTPTTCTLRQAVEAANANAVVGACGAGAAGPDTVSLLGRTGTITLLTGQLVVTESVTVQGPGATVLAVSGNNAGRVFDVVDILPDSIFTTLTIDGLTVRDGTAVDENGGCIRAENTSSEGLLVLTNSIVSGCAATSATGTYGTGMGGAVFGDGDAADKYTTPSLLLQNSTVTGNHATLFGGGIFAYAMQLTNSVISGNTVDGATGGQTSKYLAAGGGAAGLISIVNGSTISGNRVASSAGDGQAAAFGGGLFSLAALVQNSTISQNSVFGPAATQAATTAFSVGGGIAVLYGAVISNTTISGNLATAMPLAGSGGTSENWVSGGGLWTSQSGAAAGVYNSTIAGNAVEASGAAGATDLLGSAGIAFIGDGSSTSTTIYSSIVANSVGGPDVGCQGGPGTACAAPLTINGDHNLIMTSDASISLPGDTLTANPMLALLADNGGTVAGAPGAPGTGPVRTHALFISSPATNAGSGTTPAPVFGLLDYDQRGIGYPRVLGAAADIGAFEGNVSPFPTTPIPTLGPLALGLLSALLAFAGLLGFRRRIR